MCSNRLDSLLLRGLVLVLVIGSASVAWGPYSHYIAGQPKGLGSVANAPDYWGTSFEWHWYPTGGEIKPLFAWSHGCMRNGVTLFVAATPTTYREADAVAEDDMQTLLVKMGNEHRNAENCTMMVDTIRGYLCHNTLDSEGHFFHFPGPTSMADPVAAGAVWLFHGYLEEYVDYVIVDTWPGGGRGRIAQSGGSLAINIGVGAHPGILLLGQKCFRKNRHTVDAEPALSSQFEPGPVETIATTIARLADQAAGLTPKVFTTSRLNDLRMYVNGYLYPDGDADELAEYIADLYDVAYRPAAEAVVDGVPYTPCSSPAP